ncbi:MAG: hypothetical protein JXQ90_13195 [Cyclobacteriaceae bacterium]
MKYVLGLLICVASTITYGQHVIEMNEDAIDMKILTWHYDRYQGSTSANWFVKAQDGIGYVHVEFSHNNSNFEAIYNEEGQILAEKEFIAEDKIPQPVIQLLDYRIVKYKIDSFSKESEFESRQPSLINYRVQAKVKSGGVVVFWFDQDFNLIPENRDEIAIR